VAARPRIDAALLARARRALPRRDARLGALMRAVGPCGLRRRGDPYRYLVRSILYQQLAGAAARAIEGRLHARFGGSLPPPAALARAPLPTLRAAGLSRAKALAVRGAARAFADGTLRARRFPHLDDCAVVAALTQLRGVGEWTAHMLLMFSLGRPDVLPVGDYGVRKGARRLYGLAELPAPRELEALAEPWRPYRSIATWYLWRAAEVLPP